eukprot:TRINITY_DN7592_c0_g1_i1.p1 TRINITY_DN7592_c0_g1~~TRINITY_DN7592_c0_g1_i1.p1  ORF type:complete len:400 (+),score=103.86 TRINITY_DN7592_c0_g1_i1:31-1200(+)
MAWRMLNRSIRAMHSTPLIFGGMLTAGTATMAYFRHEQRPQFNVIPVAMCAENKNQPMTRYTIADAVDKAAPAVVNITVLMRTSLSFGSTIPVGTGSGFIIAQEGSKATIVTNAHVVAEVASGRGQLQVTMADESVYEGWVKHFDLETDIAIVEMEAPEPMPVVTLGKSQDLRAGEWIVAIGSPLALSNSIAAGIVSNVRRRVSDIGLRGFQRGLQYIQTDAAINEGNSGGPIVNMDGEVVGIASMKAAGANVDGVSFAIPIDFAMRIVSQLERNGQVRRPYAGVQLLTLDQHTIPYVRQKHNVPLANDIKYGVLVARIQPDGPAQEAGLARFDVITKAAGQKVMNADDFIAAMAQHIEAPQGLELEVRREQETLKVWINPQEQVPSKL